MEAEKPTTTKNKHAVHFSSKRDDHATPWPFFKALDEEFHFTLDVCAEPHNAKCKRYFSPEDDGLSQPWDGVCWMNPPYGRNVTGKWIEKARQSAQDGATVVCLIPARTDTRFWHEHVMHADEIRLVKGRIRFVGSESGAPFPSAVVVFRPGEPRRLFGSLEQAA